jgi:hypothetical protein
MSLDGCRDVNRTSGMDQGCYVTFPGINLDACDRAKIRSSSRRIFRSVIIHSLRELG